VPESQAGESANGTTQPTTAPTTPPTTNPNQSTTATTRPRETDLSNGKRPTSHGRSLAERILFVVLILASVVALWAVAVPSLTALIRHRRRTAAVAPNDRVLLAWQEANGALAAAGAGRQPHETLAEHAGRAPGVARLGDDAAAALADLADSAAVASYAEGPVPPDVALAAMRDAEAVEDAVSAASTRRQRVVRALDPRPLVKSNS